MNVFIKKHVMEFTIIFITIMKKEKEIKSELEYEKSSIKFCKK